MSTIRPLRTHEELQACLTLQRETWGDAPGTLVPTPLLIVVQRIGGVAAGAFDASGRLLGFVFGMTGIEQGELVHWSDMLAVRPEARDLGLGRRLKEYQRKEVERLGVRRIYWTYDPLVAKNAYLNIRVLGARAAEYVPDMYGDTGSPLHAGLGTDRIIVAWDVGQGGRAGRGAGATDDADGTGANREAGASSARPALHDGSSAPVLNSGGDAPQFHVDPPRMLRIEIPLDIFAVREHSGADARRWRTSTRAAFEWALAHGYEVVDVMREAAERDRGHSVSARAWYLLERRA